MNGQMPLWATLVFLAIVTGLFALLVAGAHKGSGRRNTAVFVALGLGAWLLFTGALSAAGFFTNFSGKPPRIVLAIAPAWIVSIVLPFHPAVLRWIRAISGAWLIAPQSFRVVLEVVLWVAHSQEFFPRVATFEGRNFDIFMGLSAPVVAWICFANASAPSLRLALVWNVVSLCFIANVVGHALLAAPTFMQTVFDDHPNILIGFFPYTWLASFVVPVAVFLNLASIRQIRGAMAFSGQHEVKQTNHSRPVS